MFDTLIAGAGKFLSGGALGVVGALGGGVLNLIKAKNKGKNEVEILRAKLALLEKGGDPQVLRNIDASYEHDKASYKDASGIDIYRGSVRPTITYYLTVVFSAVAVWAIWKVGIDPETTKWIANKSIMEGWALTGICIGYYFGSRSLKN